MTKTNKKPFFSRIRNNFITGVVVLIPIGINTTIPAMKLFLILENIDFFIFGPVIN